MKNLIDRGSLIVAAVTLGLFIAALFTKGLSHDLFLEAGVFLVSVKLILMAHGNRVSMGRLERKLDAILSKLSDPGGKSPDQPDRR